MISATDIQKLAALARININTEEQVSLANDMQSILGYVEQLQTVSDVASISLQTSTKNVMRDDTVFHESGIHTEAILAEAPQREVDYVKVKKIL